MQPQLARGYQIELVNNVIVDSLVPVYYWIMMFWFNYSLCFSIYLRSLFFQVLLKLERHAREQAKRGADLAQGVLLGLSSPVDHNNPSGYLRVEVTSSFPHLPALPAGAEVTADKRDEELTNRVFSVF